jgi:glyoxylase-like metal-dependent hydrolase (beta-lactamase superfamily II)
MDVRLERLGKAVFAVIGEDGATNFGIIRGGDGAALLVDADIRRIDEIEEALKRAGCRSVKYLFITHENFDHASANDYFEKKGAVVIASQGCRDALMDDGDAKFAEMAGRSPELFGRHPGLRMRLPQIVFATEMTLRMPGATVHLRHYDQSHSRGDSTAYFVEEEIFFPGDLLYTDYHPVTIYGRIDRWIKTLGELRQLSYSRIVPGHGPCGPTLDIGRQQLASFQRYLEEFCRRLDEAKTGRKSAQQIVDETYEAYPSFGKRWMVKRNVEFFLRQER